MKYLKGKMSPFGDINFGFNSDGWLEVSTSPIINGEVYEVNSVKEKIGKVKIRFYEAKKATPHTTVECLTTNNTLVKKTYDCIQNADVKQTLISEEVIPFKLQDITVMSASPYEAVLQIKGYVVECDMFPVTKKTNIEWCNGIATVTTSKNSTLTIDNEIIVTVPQGFKTHTVTCTKDEISRITVDGDYVYLLPRYTTNIGTGGLFYEDAD